MISAENGGRVTAEIAILNKTAVALAADSAVTISAGSSQEKIYDTADKLFELSDELAKMAEALVNLTSIKRRVSRGMETVGGAIDVAVISKSEGFIWVKRKHYFPEELNYRFFDRTRATIGQNGSEQHGQNLQSGTANA